MKVVGSKPNLENRNSKLGQARETRFEFRVSRHGFLLLGLAFALAACGGGGGTPTTIATPNPVPMLSSLSPTSATAGGAGFQLTVNGTNFISSSVVRWNGSNRATTFVSSTELRANISASDIANGGTAQVTVFNPTPGGGTSNPLTFTINNPQPTLSAMAPSSATVGGSAFTLTVTGTGFVQGSVVRWDGNDRTTAFQTSTQVRASIPASDIAAEGTAQVTVFNPTPGGGLSNALTFTITPPGALFITTTRLPPTSGNKVYDFTLAATGGTPPFNWSLAVGNVLPPALTLDASSGRISGTVTPVGIDTPFDFTVEISDSGSPTQTDSQALSILVRAAGPGRNDICPTGAVPISNGAIRASISPFRDIDVYSFQGTAGAVVTIEIFAQRLELDGNPSTRDSWLDSVIELLDSACNRIVVNDDIDPGIIQDSLIQNFTLPSTGTFFIRVRDFRGDGRPDLIYELRLTGAN